MSRSLERRLASTTLFATAAMLAAMALVVFFGVRDVLVSQLDRALLEEARLVSALVELDATVGVDLENLKSDQADRGRERALVELWDARGASIYRSPALENGRLADARHPDEDPEFRWIDHGSERLRAVAFRFVPRDDLGDYTDGPEDADDEEDAAEASGDAAGGSAGRPAGTPEVDLVLARPDDSVAAVLSKLIVLLLACAGALGLGAIAVSGTLARRGLKPLEEFASRIAEIDDRSLSSRLDVETAPSEVLRVGQRLNELLDSLEATFDRERAFSADIAHELRTPLASLRSTVEVALRQPREAAAYVDALEEAHAAALKLQAMVDRLLWLVRLDAGTVEIEVQSVDVAALLEDTWRTLAPEAEARRLRVRWDVDGSPPVRTDPMLAGIALRNVLENSVAYANEGGEVNVRVARRADRVVVEVENSGSHVRQEDVPNLLRRFTRGDSARTPVGSRCGLGLALVDRIARVLDHLVEIRTRPGESFSLALSMSAATAL